MTAKKPTNAIDSALEKFGAFSATEYTREELGILNTLIRAFNQATQVRKVRGEKNHEGFGITRPEK